MSSKNSKLVGYEEMLEENGLGEINDNNYKIQFKEMKKKMKFLIREKEVFQQTLKTSQLQLLKAQQKKQLLLDKLVEFENVTLSSSDDELTESSDEDDSIKPNVETKNKVPAKKSSSRRNKQSVKSKKNPKIAKKQKPYTPKTSKSSMKLQSNRPCSTNVLSTAKNSKTLDKPKSGVNNCSQHNLATNMFDDNSTRKSKRNRIVDLDTPPIYDDEEMENVDILN